MSLQLTNYAQRRAARISPALANSLLWDAIVQTAILRLDGYPVVRLKGRYYLLSTNGAPNGVLNPWPAQGQFCRLLARGDDADLVVMADGLVQRWRRGLGRQREVVGVQDDISPVFSLPVARADATAGSVRPAVPGAGARADDEQLPGRIRRRLPGGDVAELPTEGGS